MEKYNTKDILVENIVLQSNTQTSITEKLSFLINIKKLSNETLLQSFYCRIEFVLDIANDNTTFDIIKSEPKDYKNEENITIEFPEVKSLSELLTEKNIKDSFWCNISSINIYLYYKLLEDKKEEEKEEEKEEKLKIIIPTNIYKDTMTDNVIYKTTYNPFDYM